MGLFDALRRSGVGVDEVIVAAEVQANASRAWRVRVEAWRTGLTQLSTACRLRSRAKSGDPSVPACNWRLSDVRYTPPALEAYDGRARRAGVWHLSVPR